LIARRGEAEAYLELQGIAAEAGRASEIVARLVALAHSDRVEVEQVDLRTLLTNLANFREPEWKQRGVQLRNLFDDTPLYVLGSRGQLEQVFLNLLVHAEQSLAAAKEKKLSLAATIMNRRVQLEISYSSPTAEEHDPFEEGRATEAGALGLGVCRGIIQGHGGEIRLLRAGADGARFEVELPLSQAVAAEDTVRAPVRASGRSMTTLLVEPEAAVQRQLLGLLSARGHRVVPISSAEEAEDLVGRLRFELVLCSVRLPGSNWVELFERVHLQIGAFVLLTEGYDGDLARAFQGREGHVLRKPVQESELEVLLGRIEPRLEQPPAPKP
jgi:CheY-like chemotaxis protein